MSLQPLPLQEPKRPCHSLVRRHKQRDTVKVSQVPEPLAWLDQLEVVVSQAAWEQLREEFREPQPVLIQQWLLDLEQWLDEPVPEHRTGQQEQVA